MTAIIHPVAYSGSCFSSHGKTFFSPLEEENYEYILTVPVPGLKRKDLEVRIEGNTMIIRSMKHRAPGNNATMWLGTVLNTFLLPHNANTSGIKATCKNGVLTIKIEKIKPRRVVIPVQDAQEKMHGVGFVSWWKTIKHALENFRSPGSSVSGQRWVAIK